MIVASRRYLGVLALASMLPATGLQAQSYRAQPDAQYLKGVNRYRMYHVQGADTVGPPVTDVAAERREWRGDGSHLVVVIEKQGVGWNRDASQDTFRIAPNGRVLAINGGIAPRGRMDLLLNLPPAPLKAGSHWRDTVEFSGTLPPSGQHYRVERSYSVRRILDSAGSRYALVEAQGQVHYRDAFWADSVGGAVTWIDVEGPVHETFGIDLSRGAMVYRAWDMHLRGEGARGSGDTVVAGLLSTDTLRTIPEAEYRLLTRALPVGDTSFSVTTGVVFVHVAQSSRDSIAAAMLRADGLVGTVAVDFRRGKPWHFASTWTGATDTIQQYRITSGADGIREEGVRHVLHPLPAGLWAIADYGMPELVIPALLEMPRDGGTTALQVYRPVPGKWTSIEAWVRPLGEHFLASLHEEGEEEPSFLVFDAYGRLMYGENSGPRTANRVLRPGSARRAEVDRLLAELAAPD